MSRRKRGPSTFRPCLDKPGKTNRPTADYRKYNYFRLMLVHTYGALPQSVENLGIGGMAPFFRQYVPYSLPQLSCRLACHLWTILLIRLDDERYEDPLNAANQSKDPCQ